MQEQCLEMEQLVVQAPQHPEDLRELLLRAGDEDAEVEALLQRVADGVLAEDRREAIAQLKELLVDNPKVTHLRPTPTLTTARHTRDWYFLLAGESSVQVSE
jgi:hypothetical protein